MSEQQQPRSGGATPPVRTSVITPAVHGLRAFGLTAVLVVVLRGQMSTLLAVGIALIFAGVSYGVQLLQWWYTTYWFDSDGDLRVDTGVLQRNERRLQLSRLQAVDVKQPVLARIFGLAEVTIDVAGSRDSRVALRYLNEHAAQDLRNQVLARAAGVRHDAGEAPEHVLVRVPSGSLFLAYLLSTRTVMLLTASVGFIILLFVTQGVAGLLGAVVTGGLPFFGLVGEVLRWFDATIAESPDGLRVRGGLLARVSQTVPPGRVQAISFEQSLLWAKFGWVRVRINVAGMRDDKKGGSTVLLPVAPWPVATAVAQRIMPGLDFLALDWIPAPKAARQRHPVEAHRLAMARVPAGVATRSGFWVRRWHAMPHVRMQSVRISQGWVTRRLGLASIHFDSTPGPVHIVARSRPADTIAQVAFAEVDAARAARASDGPARWGRVVSQ